MNVEEEVEKLKVEIQRLGSKQDDGSYKVIFFSPHLIHELCLWNLDFIYTIPLIIGTKWISNFNYT